MIDAELDLDPPAALAARYGVEGFWERWTRAECGAKLDDVPIARWLRRHGLSEPDPARFLLRTGRLPGGIVVSWGTHRPGCDARVP